jgi:hypothetical protein
MIDPLTNIAEIPVSQHADAITSTQAAVLINVSPQLVRYWAHNRDGFPPVIGKIRGKNGRGRFEIAYGRAAMLAWFAAHKIPLRNPAIREISLAEAAKHYKETELQLRMLMKTDPRYPKPVRVIDNGDARLRLIYFDQNKLDTYFEMRSQNPAEVVEKTTKFANSLAQQFFKAMPNTARRAG